MTDVFPPTWADFRAAVRANIERQLARETAESDARRIDVVTWLRSELVDARSDGEVGQAWLFGSFAWGQPGERSDVDVLVEDCPEPFRLAARISAAFDRDAHVIQRESAPESILQRVLAEGVRLWAPATRHQEPTERESADESEPRDAAEPQPLVGVRLPTDRVPLSLGRGRTARAGEVVVFVHLLSADVLEARHAGDVLLFDAAGPVGLVEAGALVRLGYEVGHDQR